MTLAHVLYHWVRNQSKILIGKIMSDLVQCNFIKSYFHTLAVIEQLRVRGLMNTDGVRYDARAVAVAVAVARIIRMP